MVTVADDYELAYAQIDGLEELSAISELAASRLADVVRAALALAQERDHSGTFRAITCAALRRSLIVALGTDFFVVLRPPPRSTPRGRSCSCSRAASSVPRSGFTATRRTTDRMTTDYIHDAEWDAECDRRLDERNAIADERDEP